MGHDELCNRLLYRKKGTFTVNELINDRLKSQQIGCKEEKHFEPEQWLKTGTDCQVVESPKQDVTNNRLVRNSSAIMLRRSCSTTHA